MTRRLLLGYVAIVLVLSGALAVPFGIVFGQRQRERFSTALERDAVVLAVTYEDALQEGSAVDPRAAATYAASTAARVVVVDGDGSSVVDTDGGASRSFLTRPEIETALAGDVFSGTRFSQTLGTNLFVVSVPVASGSSVFGAVRLTMFNSEIESQVRQVWLSLALVVLVAVAATAVIAGVTARSIARPVGQLRDAASRIASGDLSARTTAVDAPPEIVELSDAFNVMAGRLEQLIESQRGFVADASHQLRTPLTALRLRLENLQADIGSDHEADVVDVMVELERLGDLVEQLLVLSREDEPELGTADLADAVRQRIRLWEGPAADRSQSIESDASPTSTCRVVVVPGGLEQMLDNLLDNAIRYSPEGGSIRVSVGLEDDDWCLVAVSDTGLGLREGERDRLFDRFWRGRTDQPGTGLGLAIVEHLATRSGGSVFATASPSGGLTITIRLPAATTPTV